MKIVFATTSDRKLKDIERIIKKNNFDIEVLTLNDIGWNLGEIEESGQTLEENSQIKALAIHAFCLQKGLNYIVLADDAGLFVNSLNGEPGVYTGRYADQDLRDDPSLPKHECVNKLLRVLNNSNDRSAQYRCIVTAIYPDGKTLEEGASTNGRIAFEISEPIIKPYFYTIFTPNDYDKTFNNLTDEELYSTYRFVAIENILKRLLKKNPTKKLE